MCICWTNLISETDTHFANAIIFKGLEVVMAKKQRNKQLQQLDHTIIGREKISEMWAMTENQWEILRVKKS